MSAPSLTTGVGNTTTGSQRVELPVSGLSCPTCVQSLEGALRAVPGVARATVNLVTERASVEYDPEKTSLSVIHEAMKTAGYRTGAATARFAIKGIMAPRASRRSSGRWARRRACSTRACGSEPKRRSSSTSRR